ncbi:MAG: thymidine phosphorylase [candidate division WOR-3 bacterium]|nr:thymidine phosphorylase [candidate division WOR-3 bacterium]
MNIYEIITKKKQGKELTSAEIEYLVLGYTKGEIPDYQFAAFLMAVWFQGMSFSETTHLTKAMMHSGKIFDLSAIKQPKIDKHSTGGVGDKVSLILAPLVADCGIVVPMCSGRGLGHTGGTLDKLESIPGFRTNLTEKEFITQLKQIGVAMIGQTEELAPADKKIYALRDVTATVDSIPLISTSIMSKKLAEGIDGLVLDVKTGSGAFMRRLSDAKKLAQIMCEIGKRMGKKVSALITDMAQPLGKMVGNSLEVIEAIETLKGRGPQDLLTVTITLAEAMLSLAGIKRTQARKMLIQSIKSESALKKFRELIKAQNGDERVIDDYTLLPQPQYEYQLKSPQTGYIQKLDALTIGLLSVELGCGRKTLTDKIDYSAGFIFYKKIGDKVKKDEPLAKVVGQNQDKVKSVGEQLLSAYKITTQKSKPPPLIKFYYRT